jgi:hypothetical protein
LNEKVNDLCYAGFVSLQRIKPMRKKAIILTGIILLVTQLAMAQCSICTKTASQLGEGPAKALNSAIIYLAAAPFLVMGYIGYRWWKNEKEVGE